MNRDEEYEDWLVEIFCRIGMLFFALVLLMGSGALFIVALLGMIAGIRAGQ